MQRRGGSEQPVKGQRGSAIRPKARKAPTAPPVSPADLQEQLDRRTRERDEALEQLGATSEVLQVISSSPTDLQAVLDAVGENAAHLCEANNVVIFRLEGGLLRQVAARGHIPITTHPPAGLPVDRDTVTGRAVFDRTGLVLV